MKRLLISLFLIFPLLFSSCQSVKTPESESAVEITDEWGISLCAKNVTASSMTVEFVQNGGEFEGDLQTGEWFLIEKNEGFDWTPIETNPLIDYTWNMIAYPIKKNETTKLAINWEWLYGKLEPGEYRLSKEIMRISGAELPEKKIYYVSFKVEEK